MLTNGACYLASFKVRSSVKHFNETYYVHIQVTLFNLGCYLKEVSML